MVNFEQDVDGATCLPPIGYCRPRKSEVKLMRNRRIAMPARAVRWVRWQKRKFILLRCIVAAMSRNLEF
jgi:hypothetical protein